MDLFKEAWVQAGALGLLFAVLICGNWLQWKRDTKKDTQILAMAKETAMVAATSAASADKQSAALDRATAAIQALSLLVAGRGAKR
jgi:hypothetical protein